MVWTVIILMIVSTVVYTVSTIVYIRAKAWGLALFSGAAMAIVTVICAAAIIISLSYHL